MRRSAPIVALVLALVIAGCAGFTTGDDRRSTPGGTLTDASDGGDSSTAAVAANRSRNQETTSGRTGGAPPGVADGRLVDPAALYRAHVEVLDDTSYRSTTHLGQTAREQRRTVDVTVRANATTALVNFTVPSFLDRTGYVTADGLFRASWHRDPPSFAYVEHGAAQGASIHQFRGEEDVLRDLLAAGGFEVHGTETRDGRRYVRLRATEVVDATDGNVTAIDATALVRADGLVREFDANYTVRTENESFDGSVTYDVTLTEPRSIVRPAWTSEVTTLEARLVADGRLVRLDHRGGPALGEFASVALERNGVLAQGALSDPVEAGGTLYLYTTGDGPAAQLSIARERPTVTDEFRQFGTDPLTVSVENGRRSATILVATDTGNASE